MITTRTPLDIAAFEARERGESICIGCRCTDSHACEGGCSWVLLSRSAGIGLCSSCEVIPAPLFGRYGVPAQDDQLAAYWSDQAQHAGALIAADILTPPPFRQRAEIYARTVAAFRRLTRWVQDLQSGMYVNCVYCGHRYGPQSGTPVAMADVLRAHVEKCPQHPMSAARALLERLSTDVEAAIGGGADWPIDPACPECLSPEFGGGERASAETRRCGRHAVLLELATRRYSARNMDPAEGDQT